MNHRILAVLALLLLYPAQARAQSSYVTVAGSSMGGSTPITGTVTFQPSLPDGTPVAVRLSAGGIASKQPITAAVTAGAFSVSLPDVSTTIPANVCYKVTMRTASGLQVLGPGYSCVQPSATADWCAGGICFLDNYHPMMDALRMLSGLGCGGSITTECDLGVPLVLPGNPTAPLQAATKQYVDAHAGGGGGGSAFDGGSVTNPIVLPADPTTNLQAATKQYVDAHAGSGRCPFADSTNVCLTSFGAVSGSDATAALRAAIAALPSGIGGTVWFPDGVWPIAGAFQDPTGSKAQIPMPAVALGSAPGIQITLKGLTRPVGYSQTGGAIITTAAGDGNLFGGFVSSGPFGGFISTNLALENLRLRSTSTNPCVVLVNAKFMAGIQMNHVWFDSAAPGVPSCTTGAPYLLPTISNNVNVELNDVSVTGFYSLGTHAEHANMGQMMAANSHLGWVMDADTYNTPRSTWGNTVRADMLWCQLCDNVISGGSSDTTIMVNVIDAEVATQNICYDPSNHLHGKVWVNVPYADGRSTSTPTAFHNTGCANLDICNLKTGACSLSGAVGASGLPSNPLENWASQDGSGTALANTGSDAGNTANATSVTWSAAAGFAGSVATYNGTTSYALASSATNTAFDGSAPFSACVWFNPTSVAPSDQWLFGNFTGANYTGYGLELYNSGATTVLHAQISNNISTNHVSVFSSAGVAAGALTLGCMTYDGSKTAAGTKLYINGSASTGITDADTLTGSTVSGAIYLGSLQGTSGFFGGPMGRVKLWNFALTAGNVSAIYAAGPSGY